MRRAIRYLGPNFSSLRLFCQWKRILIEWGAGLLGHLMSCQFSDSRRGWISRQDMAVTHNTVSDDWIAFGIQTRHHSREEFELLVYCVGDEIGIDEDVAVKGSWHMDRGSLSWPDSLRRNESGVVLEEKGGRDLRSGIMSVIHVKINCA